MGTRDHLYSLDAFPGLAVKDRRRPSPAHSGEESKAVPLFGCEPYTPQSKCPHHGPIRKGSVFVCMVCHQYGREHQIVKPASGRAKPTRHTPHPTLKGGR